MAKSSNKPDRQPKPETPDEILARLQRHFYAVINKMHMNDFLRSVDEEHAAEQKKAAEAEKQEPAGDE